MPFPNRIRLPFTLRSPQFIDEQEKFRKANGNTVVLSAVVRKQYEGITDYLPEKLHERLKISLVHDIVNIEGERYVGGVTQEGEYSIAWPEFLNYPLGQATFKVEVNNYTARNTNCGTCAEYSQVVCEDDNIGDVEEDETVIVAILYNDAICCSPFEISLVTFNNTYLDSCNIVGNTLEIHTKTGIPTQNNVILATYRVTCDNGTYDEANVIANVQGSIEECLSPTNLLVISGSTTASATWDAPSPEPACGYDWNLYLSSDLGTPIQSGSEPDTNLALSILIASTDYVLMVAGNCCDSDLSPYVSRSFSTTPPTELEICGNYLFTLEDNCGFETHRVTVSYLNCNDEYQQTTVFTFQPKEICLKQTSPGNPVYYEVIGTTLPPECQPPQLTVEYIEPC